MKKIIHTITFNTKTKKLQNKKFVKKILINSTINLKIGRKSIEKFQKLKKSKELCSAAYHRKTRTAFEHSDSVSKCSKPKRTKLHLREESPKVMSEKRGIETGGGVISTSETKGGKELLEAISLSRNYMSVGELNNSMADLKVYGEELRKKRLYGRNVISPYNAKHFSTQIRASTSSLAQKKRLPLSFQIQNRSYKVFFNPAF
jgi:hypothetical protein